MRVDPALLGDAIRTVTITTAALEGHIALHKSAAATGDQPQITAARDNATTALHAALDAQEAWQTLLHEDTNDKIRRNR